MKKIFACLGFVLIAILAGCGGETAQETFSQEEVTETSVHAALANVSGTDVELGDNITKIEVNLHAGTDAPNDYIVHVYFKPDSLWDEEHAVRVAVHTSIRAMEILFQNTAVSEVVMWEVLEFTDQYGATEDETAVRIVMDRDTADKVVDWEEVDDRAWGDYNTFFGLAELQYVHPAILRELE